jgi:hypothetical protein
MHQASAYPVSDPAVSVTRVSIGQVLSRAH